MGKYKYCTNRLIPNKNGEPEKGKIKVWVKKGSDTAEADYTCPECQESGHVKKKWKRPFSVKCPNCGYLIRVSRLKGKKK